MARNVGDTCGGLSASSCVDMHFIRLPARSCEVAKPRATHVHLTLFHADRVLGSLGCKNRSNVAPAVTSTGPA